MTLFTTIPLNFSIFFFIFQLPNSNQGISQFDLNFFNSLFAAVVCVSASLPFCYLSTSASENLKSVDKFVYNSLWYTFPAAYQRYITLLLVPSVHVRELSGYGFINCSLETFKKVLYRTADIQRYFFDILFAVEY